MTFRLGSDGQAAQWRGRRNGNSCEYFRYSDTERHSHSWWGDLSDEDRKENDYSLEHGFRLLSSYRAATPNWPDTTWLAGAEQYRFRTG
ncbi:MAG TPA: hypothetical protein VHF01_09660 [Candidatus Acidoferrum sp.]|nr:hypothetical protein [Candidatus Acidoferrum sp.]